MRSVIPPDLLGRARDLATGGRRILGITGAPGAGKSTLAGALVDALGPAAALVPMDGYHLANVELERLGRRDRKGAADTFDAAGYVALLRRLRNQVEPLVYAPLFVRQIEEPIAGALPVPSTVALVVTEGNYLLVDDGDWADVRPLLDEVWFVAVPEAVRRQRLVSRHVAYGKDLAAAQAWTDGTDQHNAEVIAATRDRADLVIECPPRKRGHRPRELPTPPSVHFASEFTALPPNGPNSAPSPTALRPQQPQ